MPKLDGCEATRRIRAVEKALKKNPAIIFGFTALDCNQNDLEHIRAVGMNGCLQKGCDLFFVVPLVLDLNAQEPHRFPFINKCNVTTFPFLGDQSTETSKYSC